MFWTFKTGFYRLGWPTPVTSAPSLILFQLCLLWRTQRPTQFHDTRLSSVVWCRLDKQFWFFGPYDLQRLSATDVKPSV